MEADWTKLTILRTLSAVTTVVAATLGTANLNAGITVAGFIIFIIATIACKKERRAQSGRPAANNENIEFHEKPSVA
jgi:hypothetical protein